MTAQRSFDYKKILILAQRFSKEMKYKWDSIEIDAGNSNQENFPVLYKNKDNKRDIP